MLKEPELPDTDESQVVPEQIEQEVQNEETTKSFSPTKFAFILILTIFLGAVVYNTTGFTAKSTPHSDCEDCEDKKESNILSGRIGIIEPSLAATMSVVIKELDTTDATRKVDIANKVAEVVSKLGSIGEISCDLDKKIFTLEYDKEKLNADQIITELKNAGFTILP